MSSTKLDRATYGEQALLRFSKGPAGAQSTIFQNHVGVPLVDAGALNVEGNYDVIVPTDGLADIQIHLMPSAVTGSITPVIETLYANGKGAKQAASAAAFVAATLQTVEISDLLGVKAVRIRIPVGAAESVTFAQGADPETPTAVAEYNGA